MDINIGYIIAGVAFLVVFTGYMLIDAVLGRKERVQKLESKVMGGTSSAASTVTAEGYGTEDLVGMDQEKSPLAAMLEGMMSAVGIKVDEQEEIQKEIQHAGITSPDVPVYIIFMKKIGGWILAFFGVIVLMGSLGGPNQLVGGMTGVLMIAAGIIGPSLYLKNKIQRRQQVLIRSFPDTLDLMVVCVESGLALDAALGRVCKELGRAHPEITKELNRTRLELALLNDRSQALQNLADRTNLVPFRSLVAALIQTEKFGTSLTDTLRVLSEDYRMTRLSMAETKAGRLPTLMTIPLILLLMPVLLMVILGPAFIRVQQQGGLFGDGK